MREFTLRIGHPQRFSEMGVSEQDIVKAADLSLSDGSIVNNPRIVMDSSEVLDIFQKTF
jgi:alcohol dehydrogenase class IV